MTPDFTAALGMLAAIPGTMVLELGAGLGCESLRVSLGGARVHGLDLSEARCRVAQQMCRRFHPDATVSFLVGDATAIPAADGSFDRILGRDILMYAAPERILEECARVLRPGGRVVFDEALRGNPMVSVYRRLLAPRNHQQIVHYLDSADLEGLASPGLVPSGRGYFYLVSSIAFFALFILRSQALFRLVLRLTHGLDQKVIETIPGASRWAWRGVAAFVKE